MPDRKPLVRSSPKVSEMKILDAIETRFSCRAYLPTSLPQTTLQKIMELAARAPSGGNLQPWRTYVLSGSPLRRLVAEIESRMISEPKGDGFEYDIYPLQLKEPYRARQFKCGEDMYRTIGIAREDKSARWKQFRRNYRLFGAPVGLFFFIDRTMGPPQWADLGIYIQTIMLAAREFGLHTCVQEAWAAWHKTVATAVEAPSDLMLFCGMSMGFCDEAHPINTLRTERADIRDTVTFIGSAS